MQRILAAALLGFLSCSVVLADGPQPETLKKAQQAYSERGYDVSGTQRAIDAVDAFEEALKVTSDPQMAMKVRLQLAEAVYFVGTAKKENADKLSWHQRGIDVANQALAYFSITDTAKLTDQTLQALQGKFSHEQLADAAEALYLKGTNLGQWGAANGVVSSLGKWPELRGIMEFIGKINYKQIHDYGPYRTLGRGYYKIPSVLGGDINKAQKYLEVAMKSSLAKDVTGKDLLYSYNGFNNTFYADILKDNNGKAKAKEILQAFVQADITKFPGAADSLPELKSAQQDARDILKGL